MKKKIGIVCDSTADFPTGMIEELGIHMVPIHVIIEAKTYLHGVNISNDDVVECLRKHKNVKTAPPHPAEYADIYEKLVSEYDEIFSFHISNKLSKCYSSANNSMNLLFGDAAKRITIIDTGNVSISQGLIVKKAIEIMQGKDGIKNLEMRLKPYIESSFLRFTVENLFWLRKGGRVSSVAAFIGSMLDIKPIISLEDSKLTSVEKHRGRGTSLKSIIETAEENIKKHPGKDFQIWLAHVDALNDAMYMRERLSAAIDYKLEDIQIVECGSTIAVHTGPGVICTAMIFNDL